MSLRMASRPSSFFSTLTCVGDAYMARVAANGETSNDGNAVAAASRAVVGTPPPRPPRKPTEGTANKTPAPRLLLARLADAYGAAVRVARHDDLVADKN